MAEWRCEKHANVVADDRPFRPNSPDCWECWPGREAARVGLPTVPPETCPHLGAVLEFCTRCGAAGEGRHVRDCDLFERCSLVHRPDVPGLMSCDRCEHHPSRAAARRPV